MLGLGFDYPSVDMDECSLNSRNVRLGQGLNEEDSFVDRKLTIGRLPASIRVNVTDVKAVRPLSPERRPFR